MFTGLVKLEPPYHIQILEDSSNEIHSLKKMHVAPRSRLKEELKQMENVGVIKKVDGPLEWKN